MAKLNPIRLDNYCSKEAVTLLKTQMELDQDDLQEIQEDFMVMPIIGMRIKMYVKDQTKLPAKAVLGRNWIKAYVGKICVESSRLWIRRAEHYKMSFTTIFNLDELSTIRARYEMETRLTTQEDASERIENWAYQSTASSSFREPWERPIRDQGRPGKTKLNDTRAEENANQLNGETREIVEMEHLPTPPASVTLRTGKLVEKLRALVPQDPRVHSPIPVRVFNLRTTIKKPIIPELTEEERTVPHSSLSTLSYVQSKANESDEERTVVSDEIPDLMSVSDSSETSSSDESDNMEIDQLAEEDSDSSYEENNDGYSILRDKQGHVFFRDPMQQDRKWESDDEDESDEEFKSEAMNNSSGTKAPNPSPVEETDIPMPQFASLESELINTILIKPVDTILFPPNSEPRPRAITACLSASARLQRNEKVLSNLGNIRYHKATDERDEFGYTDYRNYQCFVVDKGPKELTQFNSYEPAPTGHPSLAGIDVLGVGCYQYFHGPTDNHPLRKFDNTASISSIVYDRDQLDEMRDQGLIQRIVDLKRYAEDIEIDTQLYRDQAFSIATIEERLFVTFQVHAIRADYDRKERNRFMSWGSSDARPFESIFDKSGTHLLPFDPTLNITMMHLYRTAAETYVVDMWDREAIERVNENEMLWSRKDEYLSTEKSNKVEELILILEEPFNMSVILEEIKLNTTAGHYWTLHCPYIQIIDNRYSEHFQGMNQECYHLDALANVQTQILLRKPIPTHNPFITEDEDEFLYYCAKVIDETSVNLGNTIRGLREVDMLMAEDIRVLLNFNHLDHMRFYDRFGKKYPMAWAVF
ncbi:hypothetical protein C8J56DRAFT_1062925 [Mycena floridula]|nr:hypothetical protein C8J56DRAFT_1062925 [Mycena floridula]